VGEVANPQAQRGLIARLAAPIPRGPTEQARTQLTWNVT